MPFMRAPNCATGPLVGKGTLSLALCNDWQPRDTSSSNTGGLMTARIDEVAPDLYRISLFVSDFNLQFNHFLIKDDEPLLFHTGMRRMFPAVREAVAKLIDPADLRWIGWSHFEVDECGALNQWLAAAPRATPVCGELGAMINIGDFSDRPPRGLKPGEVLETGRHRYRFVPT